MTETAFPIEINLTGELAIPQGATWRQPFRLSYSDDGGATETLWPEAGATGVMTIRADYDTPVLMTRSTADGTLTLGPQGTAPDDYTILVSASATETADPALEALGLGVWSLHVTDSFGHVTYVYHGRISLTRSTEE